MPNEVIAAARRIAGDIRASENQYDLALANNARLVAGLLETRVKLGMPAKLGGPVLDSALEAISHAAKARQALLDTHEQLARFNLRELGFGDSVPCPEDWTSGSLNVVPFGEQRVA
jgi:hypothetical protein